MLERGFTLIEIMVVVATISISAGVAVPEFLDLRSRINERNARFALMEIDRAQGFFFLDDPDLDGADFAASLPNLGDAGLIGETLASGRAFGYRFDVSSADPLTSWDATAEPIEPCETGVKSFHIDQTSELTVTGEADCSEDAVGKETAHAVSKIENKISQDTKSLLSSLAKDNPSLFESILNGMDTDQNGALRTEEFLGVDHLGLARSIKGNLTFPKDWDAFEIGNDKWLNNMLKNFGKHVRKILHLDVDNEGELPEVPIKDILNPSPLPPPNQTPGNQQPPGSQLP